MLAAVAFAVLPVRIKKAIYSQFVRVRVFLLTELLLTVKVPSMNQH